MKSVCLTNYHPMKIILYLSTMPWRLNGVVEL